MAEKEKKAEPESSAPMPSFVGMTADQFSALIATFGTTQAGALDKALKANRKENPNYPERSVFNPAGKFTDAGEPVAAKVRLRRETVYVGVRIGDASTDAEYLTPDEIELCNRFTENKTARDGKWTAIIINKGQPNERLTIDIGSVHGVDNRMGLMPMTFILRELLDGADAVNPDAMQRRMDALEQELAALKKQPAA